LGVEVQGQEVPAVEVIGLVYSGSAPSGWGSRFLAV
jgi:hypothetical protein